LVEETECRGSPEPYAGAGSRATASS